MFPEDTKARPRGCFPLSLPRPGSGMQAPGCRLREAGSGMQAPGWGEGGSRPRSWELRADVDNGEWGGKPSVA